MTRKTRQKKREAQTHRSASHKAMKLRSRQQLHKNYSFFLDLRLQAQGGDATHKHRSGLSQHIRWSYSRNQSIGLFHLHSRQLKFQFNHILNFSVRVQLQKQLNRYLNWYVTQMAVELIKHSSHYSTAKEISVNTTFILM